MTAWARERPGTALWLGVFLYAALVALLVQTIVLPRWVPALHAGHGLLMGLDAETYHNQALYFSRRIHADGWQAWHLRPLGHVPVGLASATYTLIAPEPWSLIPINAALHATAAATLFRILRMIAPVRIALAGVLPLVFFPSALTWYTQIGKDGLSVLGALLVALGWARVAQAAADPDATLGRGLLTILAGGAVAWLGRPYATDVLLGVGIGLGLLLTGVGLVRLARGRWAAGTVRRALVRAWIAALAVWPLGALPGSTTYIAPAVQSKMPDRRDLGHTWTRSAWLPIAIDRRIQGLARARHAFLVIFWEGGANMDTGTTLTSADEVLSYLPRAVHLALFAPFPSDWLGAGASPGASMTRRAAGGEMLVLYAALVALPWGIWRWRDRLEVHVLVLYCLGMILVVGLAVPNAGALFRFRYPYAALLIGLAVATVLTARPRGAPATRDGTDHRLGAPARAPELV